MFSDGCLLWYFWLDILIRDEGQNLMPIADYHIKTDFQIRIEKFLFRLKIDQPTSITTRLINISSAILNTNYRQYCEL